MPTAVPDHAGLAWAAAGQGREGSASLGQSSWGSGSRAGGLGLRGVLFALIPML